jgi:prepilin-type N-terminal cleavage/methylation domain-containing protein
MKKAFTLMELMISVVIFSFISILFFKMLNQAKHTNTFLITKINKINVKGKIMKTIYLDILSKTDNNITINNIDKNFDSILFKSDYSIHKRIRPYIIYKVVDNILYRVESRLKPNKRIDNLEEGITVDSLGKVQTFRVYLKNKGGSYLIDYRIEKDKIRPFIVKSH